MDNSHRNSEFPHEKWWCSRTLIWDKMENSLESLLENPWDMGSFIVFEPKLSRFIKGCPFNGIADSGATWMWLPSKTAGDIPYSMRSWYQYDLLQKWGYGWWFATWNLSRYPTLVCAWKGMSLLVLVTAFCSFRDKPLIFVKSCEATFARIYCEYQAKIIVPPAFPLKKEHKKMES